MPRGADPCEDEAVAKELAAGLPAVVAVVAVALLAAEELALDVPEGDREAGVWDAGAVLVPVPVPGTDGTVTGGVGSDGVLTGGVGTCT